MSAFGKPPPPHLQGFDTSRSFSDVSFAYNAAPQQASQPPPSPPLFQNASQITQMNYDAHARGSYDEQTTPYLNFNSSAIRVTSYQPSRGSTGIKFDVEISSLYEITTSNLNSIFIMFGPRKSQASLSRLGQPGRSYQYLVSTNVPHLEVAEWDPPDVPVFLLIENSEGELVEKLEVGDFTYDDEVSKRTKFGLDSGEIRDPERPQALGIKQQDYAEYSYMPGELYGTYTPQMQFGQTYDGLSSQYGRSNSIYQPLSSNRPIQQYSTSSPPSAIKVPWNSYNNPQANHTQRPSSLASAHRTSLPSISPNPRLVRTSTLDPTRNPAGTAFTQAGQFYHQAMHPLTVVLNFQSDLDSMGRLATWSTEELQARRRILHCKRSQSGNVINIKLRPVTLEERPPNSVCISCILWEEKNQCFVTSVDTIYLLEHIMAQKFPTEEKNRIRRNLEHFKPLTVKKPASDKYDASNTFFATIMGFPQPKPRNIEKDIKIFAWKSLSNALKKITSKYSVSAASTLPPAPPPPPPLLTPGSSSGYGAEPSTAMYSHPNDRTAIFSPRTSTRPASRAPTAPSFVVTGPSRVSSPPYTHTLPNSIKGDMSQPGVPPDLRGAVAMPSFSEHAHQWPAPHHMPMPPMPAPQYTPRSSWDLAVSSYADASSGSAGAGSGPAGEGEQQKQQPHPHGPHLYSPSHTRVQQRELSAALPGEQGGVKEGPLHAS